jgi:IS5 family transposase
MRQLFREQPSLTGQVVDHRHARELEGVDEILRKNPDITALVLQDLHDRLRVPGDGREGMTAEQVLRVAVLKQQNTFTYEELSFHLLDSTTYRAFCGYGVLEKVPTRSTLQRNIKAITETTWEKINRIVLGYAEACGVEDGRTVRTDGTVSETNIHAPRDSSLLWDSVRVLTRLLKRGHEEFGIGRFPDRSRRAKRRTLDVLNAKNPRKRRKAYHDLLKVMEETVGHAQSAVSGLAGVSEPKARLLQAQLQHYMGLAEWVIDQTERRVLGGESLPAEEKIFSIFEPHTDIIIKEKRETHYGHKLTLTAGTSGLITDWVVEDGNPADATLAVRMIERQREILRPRTPTGGLRRLLRLQEEPEGVEGAGGRGRRVLQEARPHG